MKDLKQKVLKTKDIFPLDKDKVYEGIARKKGKIVAFYKIWPSVESVGNEGGFHIEELIIDGEPTLYTKKSRRAFNEKTVQTWANYMIEKDVEWNVHQRTTTIYFIEAEGTGFVKIGKSDNVKSRIEKLQAGCPFSLRCIFAFEGLPSEEEKLHNKFKKDHYRGEWFYLSKDILDFIEKKKEQLNNKNDKT